MQELLAKTQQEEQLLREITGVQVSRIGRGNHPCLLMNCMSCTYRGWKTSLSWMLSLTAQRLLSALLAR